MGRNFTRLGVINLGNVTRKALEEQGWDQKTFMQKLAEQGHISNEWSISRFLNGKTDKPDGTMIMTLADLEICRNPATGQPYSFRELMLIACEELDPQTGQPFSS
ncbi:hypothetical protein HJG54_09605 [Leptolyngbya sp. NK1-12]|uniref:Uncharacterized protein n=1 Tax=Leptolyngbya sp. NK1-12 TaxID=2547451 RepID=A0AA96WEH9_9CYAN|nr:hypothetical protein [Leptolyngbya sp. NK1-12]WNZ23090.1 hypothetical protein HJG54_09605 [Leptolyngbya sp. NK1-12]